MTSPNTIKNTRGFTLIELLIVIVIIGILATALLPKIMGGPARARDVARIADLNSMAGVLETYNLDEGSYPAGGPCLKDLSLTLKDYVKGGNLPKDPGNGGPGGCSKDYWYKSLGDSGQAFILCAGVERAQTANASFSAVDNVGDLTEAQNAVKGKGSSNTQGADAVYCIVSG